MTTVDSGLRSRLFEMLVAEKAQDVFSGMGFEFIETLDRICELAVDLTGFDAAAICRQFVTMAHAPSRGPRPKFWLIGSQQSALISRPNEPFSRGS